MQDFQQRVVYEQEELSTKIEKLVPFIGSKIFNSLPVEEQDRLSRQLNHMRDYSLVLAERIKAFTT